MMLPEKESEPMSVANSMEPAMNAVMPSWLARVENSRLATSAAAPPPRPLKSATICGIAVIFTEYAPIAPMTSPIDDADGDERVIETPALRPDIVAGRVYAASSNAMNMPAAATRLPRRAVFGERSSLMPMMNRTETADDDEAMVELMVISFS